MNKVIGILLGAIVALGLVSNVFANEGEVEMKASNGAARCTALSVYKDGRYEILGSCRDLVVPFSPEKYRYMVWTKDSDGDVLRLGEILRGKFDGTDSNAFVSLFVTAEDKQSPRQPSADLVMEGEVKAILGDSGEAQVEQPKEEAKPANGLFGSKNASVTPTPTPMARELEINEDGQPSGVARALAGIGKVVGIGLVVLLVAGLVVTVVSRRRGSV